jgi:hypothetical protein
MADFDPWKMALCRYRFRLPEDNNPLYKDAAA